jgi:beta-galactosidase
MKPTIALLAVLMASLANSVQAAPRNEMAFDTAWHFATGDIAGAEQVVADDAGWSVVDTPHDWSIAGPFDEHAPAGGAGGFLPTGVAWYRKHFNLPTADSGRRVFIEFDGVMANSGVWINGMHLGHRPNGYASFRYELTPHVHFGEGAENANVLAVRADTEAQPASRWYAGSGIYRHVRLIVTGDIHVEPWGTAVTTPNLDAKQAVVRVASSVINQSKADRSAHLEIEIVSPDGHKLAPTRGASLTLPAGRAATLSAEQTLLAPRRWDIADPARHTAVVKVVADDGALLDEDSVSFGIRDARFDAATGFWLNGRNIKLKGTALHADAGAFGMAAPLAYWERRIKGLQALGVNAIRTAHHPFSPEVLDLCDRLGMLVMDEAFDMWTVAKNPYDYHLYFTDWSSIDLRDFVRRDRNHPSVIIWSAGNEIHDTPYPVVAKSILARLLKIFHDNDASRPVSMALFRPNTSGDYHNGLADMLDVVGQNYRENELIAAHDEKPTRKIIGTENGMGRGSWLAVRDYAAYAGMFLWTGADYLGEADRVGWPRIAAGSGLVDRIDQPRPRGLERASWWSEKPVVHIARRLIEVPDTSELPAMVNIAMPAPTGPTAAADWTPDNLSPHRETVEVYSNAEAVELFINKQSLGRKPRNADDSPRLWPVDFTPGTVRAVAYNAGKVVAEETLRTAGKPQRLKLIAEQKTLAPGFDNIGFVRVEVVDANGTLVPGAHDTIAVKVQGAGVLAGLDNADLSDHTPFNSPERNVLGGRALIMLRAAASTSTAASKPIVITVSAPNLESASLSLPVVAP